jgi:hypothetical protein
MTLYEVLDLVLLAAAIVADVALGLGFFWIARKTSAIDALNAKFDASEERAKQATQKLIDERVEDIRQRLDDGQQSFEKLNERDQKMELAIAGQISLLKDWIRDHTAQKDDLVRHEQATAKRFEGLVDRMGGFGEDLSGLRALYGKAKTA